MKRRDFSLQLAGLGLGVTAAGNVSAQGAPSEGQQYSRLSPPFQLSKLPDGKKVDVVEFFSYACPHCFEFEPVLSAWVRTLPADVLFRPVPVPFVAGRTWVPKVFYALEEIGQREALHSKLFSAIHVQRLPMVSEADVVKFVLSAGVDEKKFNEALKSFSVANKVNRAATLLSGYKVNSVPLIGVQGLYTAEGAVDGSHERAVPVFNYLIQRARLSA
jgi:thiol:disulfide interchange protein DsbA